MLGKKVERKPHPMALHTCGKKKTDKQTEKKKRTETMKMKKKGVKQKEKSEKKKKGIVQKPHPAGPHVLARSPRCSLVGVIPA